jgi:hypothetical protein
MKTIFLYLMILFVSLSSLSAQSQLTLSDLSICSERETELKQLLKKTNAGKQVINIWLVPPMGCPRCEGIIPVSIEMMKVHAPDELHLVWLLKHTREELKDYLSQREFDDYMLWDAADGRFEQFVHMNIGEIQTPHYLRFDPVQDKFVHQISLLGSRLSDQYLQDVISGKERNIRYIPCNAGARIEANTRNEVRFTQIEKYNIPGNSVEPLDMTISKDRKKCLFIDRFSWDAIEMNAKEDIQRFGVFSTFNADTFIDPRVPGETYRMLKSTGVLNNMLFSPSYAADNKEIRFSASIARLDFHDNEVDYFNVAVLLTGAANKPFKVKSRIQANKPEALSIMHTYTFLHPDKPLMFTGLSKGWPSSGNQPFVDNDSPESPFRKDFYENAPLFMKLDYAGNNMGFVGSMDPVYQKLRTGYYYTYTSAVFHKSEFYYSDGYSCKVYSESSGAAPICDLNLNPLILNGMGQGQISIDGQTQIPLCKAIEAPVLQLHADSQLNYILDFKSVFKDCITKFDLNDDFVLCLVYRDRKPRAILYDRKKQSMISEHWIPEKMGDAKLSRVIVNRDHKDVLWLDALYLDGNQLQWASVSF